MSETYQENTTPYQELHLKNMNRVKCWLILLSIEENEEIKCNFVTQWPFAINI